MNRGNIISLRLSESELKKIDLASQLFNMKKSEVIRKAIGDYIKFIEFEEEGDNNGQTE